VVDDWNAFRRLVYSALHDWLEVEVVAEASDGLEAVQKAQELQPDLILLDLGIPKLSGIEAASRIRELAPRSKILFLSVDGYPEIVEEALRMGASGYVAKSDAHCELKAAVEAVLQGKQFVSSSARPIATYQESAQATCC
jgi:DNA-binding NarL/FixJ family response regulator